MTEFDRINKAFEGISAYTLARHNDTPLATVLIRHKGAAWYCRVTGRGGLRGSVRSTQSENYAVDGAFSLAGGELREISGMYDLTGDDCSWLGVLAEHNIFSTRAGFEG